MTLSPCVGVDGEILWEFFFKLQSNPFTHHAYRVDGINKGFCACDGSACLCSRCIGVASKNVKFKEFAKFSKSDICSFPKGIYTASYHKTSGFVVIYTAVPFWSNDFSSIHKTGALEIATTYGNIVPDYIK